MSIPNQITGLFLTGSNNYSATLTWTADPAATSYAILATPQGEGHPLPYTSNTNSVTIAPLGNANFMNTGGLIVTVAGVGTSGTGPAGTIIISDLDLVEKASDMSPSNLAVSNITANSATLTWGATGSSYTVLQMSVAVDGAGYFLGTTSNTTFNLTGLPVGQSSTIRVIADANAWSSIVVTTL